MLMLAQPCILEIYNNLLYTCPACRQAGLHLMKEGLLYNPKEAQREENQDSFDRSLKVLQESGIVPLVQQIAEKEGLQTSVVDIRIIEKKQDPSDLYPQHGALYASVSIGDSNSSLSIYALGSGELMMRGWKSGYEQSGTGFYPDIKLIFSKKLIRKKKTKEIKQALTELGIEQKPSSQKKETGRRERKAA